MLSNRLRRSVIVVASVRQHGAGPASLRLFLLGVVGFAAVSAPLLGAGSSERVYGNSAAGPAAVYGLISGYGTPPATLPLSEVAQQIAGRLPERIETSREIDVYTGYSCGQGARFAFTLGAPASVSLAFHAFDASGDVVTFPTREPLRDQAFEAGTHEIFLGSTDLPFGSYEFRLTAEDGAGNADEHRGIARSRLNRRDWLPLSHPFVKGVDLYGGQAVISAVDVEFPGRGPGLRFTRTYNSHAGDQPTAMGQGWHSDLDSQVVSDSCGTLTVTGAAGQGQRFVPAGTDADGTLRFTPIGGYHGNLRYRLGGYDFIARDGTRYRFEGALNRLAFVEDPNGNRVTTERDLLGRATRVFDSAGRELRLSYQFLTRSQTEAGYLISESRELLTGIEASGGIRVEYDYDDAFNLVEHAGLGRRIGQRDIKPLASTRSWPYELAGNVTHHTTVQVAARLFASAA